MKEKFAYTVEEAGQAMGIKRDLVYELINKGDLRSVRLGRRRVVPVDAIRDCLERNEDKRRAK